MGEESRDASRRFDDRWMVAALPSGLGLLGPRREAEIDLGGPSSGAVLAALQPAVDRGSLAKILGSDDDADELISALDAVGALTDAPLAEPSPARGLAPALLDASARSPITAAGPVAIATADELLALPATLGVDLERRALHAFVAGIAPDLRQRAYCHVVTSASQLVCGDCPDPAELKQAMAVLAGHEHEVAVVHLSSGELTAIAPERLGQIGFASPHRLGPLVDVTRVERSGDAPNELHVYGARYATANLRFPERADARIGGGRASDPALAELIARAEAAERYTSGDLAGRELVRARAAELDAPSVEPTALFRANARQSRRPGAEIPYDPETEHLWIAGRANGGERRWLPAAAVFFPFHDPLIGGRTLPTTSSGAAAHTTYAEARLRAVAELVERDAFMWTWIQQVARELVDEASLPAPLQARASLLRERGLTPLFVNLTLDLLPVIACVIHSSARLAVTIACSADPVAAAGRAFDEGLGLLDIADRGQLELVAPEAVRLPEHHAALYQDDPARVDRASFLWSSQERIAAVEIAAVDDPLETVRERYEVVEVDLTSPATAPFHVARAVMPELVPVSFGYDREPLGMPALSAPRRTHDGRTLGAPLDLAEAGPIDPHPFA